MHCGKTIIAFIVLVFVSGCASKFSCMETVEGVTCKNLQGVYDDRVLGNGNTATSVYADKVIGRKSDKEKKEAARQPASDAERVVRGLASDESRPIYVPPAVLRIWTAPWEDSDGDLHKPGYIYCEMSQKRGHWLFGEPVASHTGSSVSAPRYPTIREPNIPNSSAAQKGKSGTADKKAAAVFAPNKAKSNESKLGQ